MAPQSLSNNFPLPAPPLTSSLPPPSCFSLVVVEVGASMVVVELVGHMLGTNAQYYYTRMSNCLPNQHSLGTHLLISLLCSIILTYLLYHSAGHTRGFLLEHMSFLLSLRKRSNIFREREVGQCCHSNDIIFSNQGVDEDPKKN